MNMNVIALPAVGFRPLTGRKVSELVQEGVRYAKTEFPSPYRE